MVQVEDRIRVYITHSVSFCDLPKQVKDFVHTICCEWGYGTGERLSFDSILEYYQDAENAEGLDKMQIVQDFMNKNDLDDTYFVDLDW